MQETKNKKEVIARDLFLSTQEEANAIIKNRSEGFYKKFPYLKEE